MFSQEFLVGMCRPVPQILNLFQTKTRHFLHPFSDLASKIHTSFRTLFLFTQINSPSFGNVRIIPFIHARRFLANNDSTPK